MGDALAQWVVGNSLLQALAITFSVVIGVGWIARKITSTTRFLIKYKSEKVDVKLRIARISSMRSQYFAARDLHVFLYSVTTRGLDIAFTMVGVVIGAILMTNAIVKGEWYEVLFFTILILLSGVYLAFAFQRLSAFLNNVYRWRTRWFRRARRLKRAANSGDTISNSTP